MRLPTLRVENGQDKSRYVPSLFLHFTSSFSYFRTNSELVRNTGCQIRKWDGNCLACILIIFVISVFYRDIPFLLIRYIPFLLLCVWLWLWICYIFYLSMGLWVVTIYCTTMCVAVNLFVRLWIIIMVYNYLCYYHLSIVFMYSCRVCWMIG